ncbi:hypothetical protein K492DRAFT_206018 [Lichtheimia hyalospora FSU 10163]|nr:hypothetical protein K492DRAFT_206018 [Lichtheimia hyalospora FSU 10163]
MNNNELKIIIPVVLGTIAVCLIMCAAVALAKSRRRIYQTERIDTFTENMERGTSNNSWLRSPLTSPRSQRYIQIPTPVAETVETRAEPTAVNDPPPAYQQSKHDVRVQVPPS